MPVDIITTNNDGTVSSTGEVASRILQFGGDIGAMRTCAILRENEWREYDQAIVKVAQERFSFIADLFSSGLTYNIKNPWAITQLVWDRDTDSTPPQIDMTAEAQPIRDKKGVEQDSIPIPIIHHGFTLNRRTLEASRTRGLPLDTQEAISKTRKIVEFTEQMALAGTFSGGSFGSLYGATKYPHRNTVALTGPLSSASSAQLFNDVSAMVQALRNDFMYGPYMLLWPTVNSNVLDKDYDTTTSKGRTIKERLMQIDGISSIKTNFYVPANNLVLIQMTSDVVQVINGLQPQMIEWSNNGGLTTEYKILSIMPVRFNRDGENHCGIAHAA